jgi:hypothetical protein
MNQKYNESRQKLLLIIGAMLIAALATGIGIIRGVDSYLSIGAFLAFLLIAGASMYQLYRRE